MLLFPFPGDLPDPGIKPGSPALHTDSLPSDPPGKPMKGNKVLVKYYQASLLVLAVKNPPASAGDRRHGLDPWVRRIHWSRKRQN